MKILSLLVFASIGLSAQTDTLNSFYKPIGSTVVASPNGGYASGTNGYADKEKLQAFIPARTYSVLGAIVWFAVKNELSAQPEQSNIWLKLRRYDITTQATVPFIRGPKETIDSVSFPITDLNAGLLPESGYNYLPFNSPVLVTSPYGISISFTEGMQAEDTLAIMHSADDSVLAVGQSWEIWNGNWRRMVDSWGLNVDFAVFPVIDTTLNSTDNIEKSDLTLWPNPANETIHIKTTQNHTHENAVIQVYAVDGKQVMHYEVSGYSDTIAVPVEALSNGIYLLSFRKGAQMASKLFLVER